MPALFSMLAWCVLVCHGQLLAEESREGAVAAETEADEAAAEIPEGLHTTEPGPEAHPHDPAHGNASPNLENASEFRTDLAIYTFIVFLILLAILAKFAWPPINRALEEREKRIASHIAAAEAKHEEAKQLLAQHEARLASAADEVRALLEEARRDAEHTKAQIISEARQAAQAEQDRALREVHQATDVAMRQLAETSAALAVQLAGKVVQEEISAAQQDRLVREAVGRLSTTSPSEN